MNTYIFDLFLVVILMLGFSHAMKRPPTVPSGLRRRHFFVTLLVLILTVSAVDTAGLFLTHPQIAFARFYVEKGFFPAWLVFSLRAADTVLGSVVCISASLLCRRVVKARRVFLWLWSPLVLLWLVECIADVQAVVGKSVAKGAILSMFTFVLFGGIGLLVARHFRSPSSEVLFAPPNTSLEPTPTAP